jgi:hypothetical protein
VAEFDYSEADAQSDDVVRVQSEYLLELGLETGVYPGSRFDHSRKHQALQSAIFIALRTHRPPSLRAIAKDSQIPFGTVSAWSTRDERFRESLR